ncbi:hypothetical protein LILAB_09635 [Corallococcus macrosporus]|uniref:Uncharacterized protein n=1 Tax=Myxococcus fulvus (strain ATCC BAA-855 / HW-1) TaxID=483219 RepID=F8CJM3_MYXFH|nr:hypothetical protein LILAB_09635 [Corallococcus macrosporus]
MYVLYLLASATSVAQPYELFAVYEPATSTGTAKTIRLKLNENALIPDGGESHVLDRLIVKFDAEGGPLSALSIFSHLDFQVDIGPQQSSIEVKTSDIKRLPNRELTLVRWRGDQERDSVVSVKLEVEAVYAGDFLCLQERELLVLRNGDGSSLRDLEPTTIPKWVPEASNTSDSKKTATGNNQPADEPLETKRTLLHTSDHDRILYSLCRGPDGKLLNDSVDWEKASQEEKFKLGDAANMKKPKHDFRKAHKYALAQRISARLNERFPSFGRTAIKATDPEKYDGAYFQVSSKFGFFVIKNMGSLFLMEESGGEVQRLADLIDQDADVAISLAQATCAQLPPAALLNNPWTFELEVPDGKDGKTRKVKAELDFRHGCTRSLPFQWKDYLNQRVTFRAIYRTPGNDDIVVLKDSFSIYNLGLITTVPVFTEIISAAQGSSASDVEATSSIPVSYAIPLNDQSTRGGALAVTFPFTVSYNSRKAPNLAEYIALAPSISLISGGYKDSASVSADDKADAPNVRVAIGVGINVARAFHFGYAWAPQDGGQYTLIGLSIPDLLPLLKGGE